MFNLTEFEFQRRQKINLMATAYELHSQALKLLVESDKYNYAYWPTWLGVPIIQLPEDIITTQEIFWADLPDVVIETGVAWGGSILMHASLMELAGKGSVIAIDRVLPEHLKKVIMQFPFSNRIQLIEGDSIDRSVIDRVRAEIKSSDSVAAFLDSDHTHDHVLSELRAYGDMVTKGQHLTVYATRIEEMPPSEHRPRPWGPGNNPMTAVKAYLVENDRFVIDEFYAAKSFLTFAPSGRLVCVK